MQSRVTYNFKGAAVLAYGLILSIAPFLFVRVFSDPSQTPMFFYLLCACLGMQALLLLYQPQNLNLGKPSSITLLLLSSLLVTGTISTVINRGNTESYYELCRTAALLIFFFTNTLLIKTDKNGLYKIAAGIAMGALAYLAIGIYEAIQLGSDFFNNQDSYPITAHLGHRNLLANYLALSLPVYMYLLFASKQLWLKILTTVIALGIALFLIFLQSRIGWLGLLTFCCFALISLIQNYSLLPTTIKTALPVSSLAVILIIAGLIFTHPRFANNSIQKVKSLFAYNTEVNQNTYTINERFNLWGKTIKLVAGQPVFGVGPGLWKFKYPAWGLAGTQAQSGVILFQRPHNDLLWYAAEYGLVGLVLFLSGILYSGFQALQQVRAKNLPALTFASGLIIFLIVCCFDFPKERPTHLFLLSFYLAGATVIPQQPFTSYGKAKLVVWLILALTVVCLIFFGVRAKGEYFLNKALAYRLIKHPAEMLENLSEAQNHLVQYDLTGTPLEFYKGETAFYKGRLNEAISYFNSALALNPYHLYTLSNMGGCYYLAHDSTKAMNCWNKAIKTAPAFGEARLNKSIALYSYGNYADAVKNLDFPISKEDVQKYNNQIMVICGAYISRLADSVQEEPVRAKLKGLSHNTDWLLSIYASTLDTHTGLGTQALKETLLVLQSPDNVINTEQREFYFKKYENLFQ